MKRLATLIAATAMSIGATLPAQADQARAEISDQRYHGGKYGAGRETRLLVNCPREFREMYRGDLYCRQPEYRVLAQRHPSCPRDVWGMYRGDLYCFGRQ